jgi:hypothetical protein
MDLSDALEKISIDTTGIRSGHLPTSSAVPTSNAEVEKVTRIME